MQPFPSNQVSITFVSRLSADISHTLMHENDEILKKLMNSGFHIRRNGCNITLLVTSETELIKVRRITQIPLFIKF